MMGKKYDVIVIGAGASGLMAAWELALTGKTVAVIEANNRIGGRIHTLHEEGFDMPVELGAEFVHGDLEQTQLLLKKGGIKYHELNSDVWKKEDGKFEELKDFIEDYSYLGKKFKELKEDISVAQFINEYLQGEKYEDLRFTLKNYVEGYDAADTNIASTFALREDLTSSSDKQYRIDNGYGTLIDFLYHQCKEHHVKFYLSESVKKIEWQKDSVEIITDKKKYAATKALITVSLGVLQSEHISFSPAIPEKINAAKKLGFGPVIKIILQFDEPLWKNKEFTQDNNLDDLGFLFTKEAIPTWWTQHPRDSAILTGWLGGPKAEKFRNKNNNEILQTALQCASNIFTMSAYDMQQKLKTHNITNWTTDPLFYGAYAFEVVNGPDIRNILLEPTDNTLFFAGEAFHNGPEIGTVEAALASGRETAYKIVASFTK